MPIRLVFVAVAVAATVALRLLAPRASARLDHGVRRVAAASAHVVGVVLLTGVWLVLFLPLWTLGKVVRARPLGRGEGWRPQPATDAPATRSFAREQRPGTATPFGRFAKALTVVVVLLAVNYLVGWGWEEAQGVPHKLPGQGGLVLAPVQGPPEAGGPGQLPLASRPALQDSPWATQFFVELRDVRLQYVPYLITLPTAHHGATINIENGVRRSWQPEAADDHVPEVWFFGGSAAWGFGQRDGHTIISEVARLAARAGRPVRVLNVGEFGWTAYQDALYFERLLSERPPPDLAVFYDGYNDVVAQTFGITTDPSHFPEQIGYAGHDPSLATQYASTSAAHKAVRWLWAKVSGDPAGALEGASPRRTESARARAAVATHRRAVHLADALAAAHGVRTLYTWQPTLEVSAGGSGDQAEAVALLRPPVVSLAHTLDGHGDDLYIDSVHTNEQGALLVAEALEPLVADALEKPK